MPRLPLKLDIIKKYYHLPISIASIELNIHESKLSKLLKKYGIARWPYRKIRSLDIIIKKLVLSAENICDPNKKLEIEEKIEIFRRYKDIIRKNPNIPFRNLVNVEQQQRFFRMQNKKEKNQDNDKQIELVSKILIEISKGK